MLSNSTAVASRTLQTEANLHEPLWLLSYIQASILTLYIYTCVSEVIL
jgi:hypothetical protein